MYKFARCIDFVSLVKCFIGFLNCMFEMKSSSSSSSQMVILGTWNCTRIIIDNPNMHNLSVSGTTPDNVQSLLDKSDNEVEADFVKKVILSLGTNDIWMQKNDVEQVNVNLAMCIESAKQKYPFAKIGDCSILPRRGKGIHLQALNAATTSVNTFVRKLCQKRTNLQYINLWTGFYTQRSSKPRNVRSKTGVHINSAGISRWNICRLCLKCGW